jgi:hypothetical protein
MHRGTGCFTPLMRMQRAVAHVIPVPDKRWDRAASQRGAACHCRQKQRLAVETPGREEPGAPGPDLMARGSMRLL